ncbi:hypothetical protein [Actinospica robiniae]|uniref:hypothetical protein n=1 Tax=Actinospica robiniae TaxID=304901 RepID=UPI0004056193|nr:hypothetical protein [Actinospica robiniae]
MESTALTDTAATGLILGGGALGCGLLVLGLTVLALRRGAREEQRAQAAQKVAAGAVRQGGEQPTRAPRTGRTGRAGRGGRSRSRAELGHDPYPQQPYSSQEPKTHQPYSRPYKVPRQEQHGSTNGHRPPDANGTGLPTTPYTPPDDES